jgi:hypothetical protein
LEGRRRVHFGNYIDNFFSFCKRETITVGAGGTENTGFSAAAEVVVGVRRRRSSPWETRRNDDDVVVVVGRKIP